MNSELLIRTAPGVTVCADGLLHDRLPHPSNGRIASAIRVGGVKESLTTAQARPAPDWERDLVDGVPMDEIVDAMPDPGAELARHMPRQLECDAPTEGIIAG